MRKINLAVLTLLLVLTGVALMPAGSSEWVDEENLTPTAKSSAKANPALLKNEVARQIAAGGETVAISLDSSNFPVIMVSVTIQDATGGYIHNLTMADFIVTEQSSLENAATVENIESFNEFFEDNGVSLAFMFDISGSMSMQNKLNQAKQAAICFFEAMSPIDRVMLMSFSGPDSAVVILPPVSAASDTNGNGIYDFIETVNNLTTTLGSTAIYDAMPRAINTMRSEPQPRAILLFTDGRTNSDLIYDINNVIQMATAAGIPVYTLGYGDRQQNLLDIANGTGGMAINGLTCENTNALYNKIARNMPSTYSIVYTSHNPSEDGTTRTVTVLYNEAVETATYTAPGEADGDDADDDADDATDDDADDATDDDADDATDDDTGCQKDCDAGRGCFIQSAGGLRDAGAWKILAGLFLILAAGGCLISLCKNFLWKRDLTIVLVMFALAVTQISPDSAQAGLRKGAISVSPMGGIYYFDDDQEIEKGPVAGLGIGYQWADNWGVELMLNRGRHDFHYLADQCRCRKDDVDSCLGRIDLLYHLWPEKNLVPYLAAGIGYMNLDFDSFDKEDDAFADYGAGVLYFLSEDIALRADVRGIYTFDDSYSNLCATIGLSFLFGGKEREKKVETPAESAEELTRPTTPAEVAALEGETLIGAAGASTRQAAPAGPAGADIATAAAAGTAAPAAFNILFKFNRSDINPALHDNFKQVADYLYAYNELVLRIEGHTDAIGSEEYNQGLSLRRARSVGDYLSTQFNIPQSRMYVIGFGESNPVADNATAEGRRLNRRAELQYMISAAAPETAVFDIRFKFDKVAINPALHDNFKQVADYLHSHQEIILGVEGHTDAIGSEEYNQALSLRRAQSVGNYLYTQFNIPHSRLQFIGFGELQPIADNADSEGRSRNRRVELRYVEEMK